MKQRIVFSIIMGFITTCIISFSLVVLNFGLRAGLFCVWFRSWAVSYPLAVLIIFFIAPRVQALSNLLINKTPALSTENRQRDSNK